jgi:hypothetical protein
MDGVEEDLRKMKIKKWWSAARNRVVEEDSEGNRGPQWAAGS